MSAREELESFVGSVYQARDAVLGLEGVPGDLTAAAVRRRVVQIIAASRAAEAAYTALLTRGWTDDDIKAAIAWDFESTPAHVGQALAGTQQTGAVVIDTFNREIHPITGGVDDVWTPVIETTPGHPLEGLAYTADTAPQYIKKQQRRNLDTALANLRVALAAFTG